MSSWKTLKKTIEYFGPYKWVFLFILFLSGISQAFYSVSTYFLGGIVDSLNENIVNKTILFSVLYLSVIIAATAINRLRDIYTTYKTDYGLYHHIARLGIRKSLRLSLGQLKEEHSGLKQDVLRQGNNSMDNLHYLFVYDFVPLITSTLVALIGLFVIDKKVFLVAIFFLVIYYSFNSFINNRVQKLRDHEVDLRKEKNKVYTDLLRNLFFIKFSGRDKFANKQLKKYQDRHENYGIKLWVRYSKMMMVSDFMQILLIVIIITYSIINVQNGILTIGLLIPIISWTNQLSHALSRVRNIQRRFMISLSDLSKMFEMLERKTDIHVAEQPIRIKDFEKNIRFENISFNYKNSKKSALEDIDLEIKKGEKVALVGKSGSGKSTLASLLLRLYDPSFGDILVDGIDLKMLSVEDWHKMISYVPQDGDLIDLTIKENVLFGAKKNANKGEIEKALKQAEAYKFVMELPNGLDTKVGERGVKLSGGQKQRICIARALIKDSPILILDEATSSLDSETEQFLNKNVWDILKDKTGIVIAHRLSTILDADKIIVVDDGKVIGVGQHKELLNTCDFYKKLVDAQNISF